MTERLNHLYTPLEEAVALLNERRSLWSAGACSHFPQSASLLAASRDSQPGPVASKLAPAQSGSELPHSKFQDTLIQQPSAVLFRHVTSPNFELARFISLAASAGLVPVVLEFQRDKFADFNHAKYALARLSFHGGTGRNGGARTRCLSVANVKQSNNLPLNQVPTHTGQPLMEFHHALLNSCPQFSTLDHCDISGWILAHGPTARQYYEDFLGLFVENAILFETFLLTPREKPFTIEIALPAFESACTRHEKRPLICRLDPPDAEGDPYWLQYPMELLPVAQGLLNCNG